MSEAGEVSEARYGGRRGWDGKGEYAAVVVGLRTI
jgi:hypothetical protein